jgi:RNA polymerase sigma factor (sigma-70 family)
MKRRPHTNPSSGALKVFVTCPLVNRGRQRGTPAIVRSAALNICVARPSGDRLAVYGDTIYGKRRSGEYQTMSSAVQPGTSTQLVLGVSASPKDAAGWDRLVKRYSGVIYAWCRRYGLQEADAGDVTQNVFLTLLGKLQTFDRSKGGFRNWLYCVVQNAVRESCNKTAHRQEKGTPTAKQALDSEPARRDLEARLKEEFDHELVELTETRVRLKVSMQYWDCYRLRCKEGLSLREAAKLIEIPAGHVSKYALRVRTMIAQEIAIHDGTSVFTQVGADTPP